MNGKSVFDLSRAHTSVPEFLTNLLAFFDSADLLVLLLVAYIAHLAGLSYFGKHPWKAAAKCITGPVALLYGFHLASMTDFYNDVGAALGTVVRTAMTACIVHNAASLPAVFAAYMLTRSSQQELDRLQRCSQELSEWHQRRQQDSVTTQQHVEPVPRELSMRRTAEQARVDFEFECEIIRTAGLDADEKEAAISEARQKYLRRLQAAMQ